MEADQVSRQRFMPHRGPEDKEAKQKRQQAQRAARREARKEKRHAKAEAKRLRKQKKTPERKSPDEKKLVRIQDKQRMRTRLRADKLEARAQKLLAKARQARIRADHLDSLEEKENEAKIGLCLENEEFIPLDDSTAAPNGNAPTTSEKDAKKKKKEKKLQDSAIDQIMEEELGPSVTAAGQHVVEDEKEKKRKRKEEKKAEKHKREAEDDGSHEAPDGDAMDVDAADEAEAPRKKKKKRMSEAAADEVAAEAEAPKEKKKKKNKKDKKDKKKKEKASGSTQEEPEPEPAPAAEATATDGAEQWNVSALEGSSKRKEKFLRLLGAKKSNGTAAGGQNAAPPSSKADIVKVQSDLERQFNTGMKMKNEGQGHKRGLGA